MCLSNYSKVDVPNSVISLKINQTHVFKWYVVSCGFKNGYQKDICSKRLYHSSRLNL